MLVTLAAIMCLGGGGSCVEVPVTNSDMMPGLTMVSCRIIAQGILAQWKGDHPIYRSEDYTVGGWNCYLGTFTPKRSA